MRRGILFIIVLVFLLSMSFASAEIIINEQPKESYSMGDSVKTSFKLKTTEDLDKDTFFSVNVLCNGIETEIMKTHVGEMEAGEEQEFGPSIPLLKSLLGRTTGTCKVKSVLESLSGDEYEYKLTNEFQIFDIVNLRLLSEEKSFDPGQELIVEGEAKKKTGEPVGSGEDSGFVEMKLIEGNSTLAEATDTVMNGYFFLNSTIPNDLKAGKYLVTLDVYEQYKGEKTNKGFMSYNLDVRQVPTNLEIIFDNSNTEIEPGTELKVKGILHDQTGQKIETEVNFTIENGQGETMKQAVKATDTFVTLPIKYNEPSANWSVFAFSNGLESEADFQITEKENAEVELINKTVMITNKGNVYYNKTLTVKIGNDTEEFNVSLGIDESRKYALNAPDGNYSINVLSEGRTLASGEMALTGRAVSVREAGRVFGSVWIWIFVIALLGFTSFIIFRKIHKKPFFGKARKKSKEESNDKSESRVRSKENKGGSLIDANKKAELSLSISGDKHNASVVCLKIKNFDDVKSNKGNISETLQKITDVADDNKAVIYENQDNLFFIFAPTKTKTFKNEKNAVGTADEIKKVLSEHNKLAKHKIEFGISVNSGNIVTKQEGDILKFMSMGGFTTNAKKLSSLSDGEVYLSKEAKEKLMSDAKTEKHNKNGVEFYTVKEMRNREENRKFISEFMKRIKDDDKKNKK